MKEDKNKEDKNTMKSLLYYILFMFFSINSIITLFTYDKITDISTGNLTNIIVTSSIIGQEIYNGLKK